MRRHIPLLAAAGLAACLVESQPSRLMETNPGPDRNQETVAEIERQQRWTGEALAGKPSAEELQAVREGDADAVSDTRKRFRRLLTAVERTTWIRETVAEVLRGATNPDRLVASFDAAGRDRYDALGATDETARALAESRLRNALSLDDLKRALQAARKAKESEQKLAAELGRRAPPPDGGADPLQRLATVPMPPQPPFIDAAARWLAAHPGEDRALDAWPQQLAQERTQIRAALADLHLPQPEAGRTAEPPAEADRGEVITGLDGGIAAAEGGPAPDAGRVLQGGVEVTGDLKKLLAKRGAPLTIAPRAGGLYAFRYREQRPCGVETCNVTVDYVFDAHGRLVRDEVVK